MSALADYVLAHTVRGECQCGKCFDKGDRPDPTGQTVDMVFFKVALVPEADAAELRRLVDAHEGEFGECAPFDGGEHGYMELGGWIGDQGLAMQFMALATMLGLAKLLSPATLLGIDGPLAVQMAGQGLLSISTQPEVAVGEAS